MVKYIAGFLKRFKMPSDRERMYAFLSQARDLNHLEQLERQWDRRKGY